MRTIKLEDGTEVKISGESYNELARHTKVDYNELIGVNKEGTIAIKGESIMLKSTEFFGLAINNRSKKDYNYVPNYEIVTYNDLNKGDVFVDIDITDFELGDFKVYAGESDYGEFVCQYITDYEGIECINYDWSSRYNRSDKVVRFLRE